VYGVTSVMKKTFLIGLLISVCLVSSAKEQRITIPMTAKDAEGFAPEGWGIELVQHADLNGDKIDDAVVVITKPEVIEHGVVKEVEKRFLVLAFGAGGQLERTALSDDAVLDKDQGGPFGDPFVGVKVENGIIAIEHNGGGGWRWRVTERYRWQQNRWMLIGKTYGRLINFDLDHLERSKDTDLSTGLVSRTDTMRHFLGLGGKREPGTTKRDDYYELQVIPTGEAQKIDGLFEAGEWQGHVLNLNTRRQVISGVRLWKGVSDVSAALNAVRQGDDLFIRAEITDDRFSAGDSI